MRTQDQIVAKVREEAEKVLSFGPEALTPYLDFTHAREFLKPETTEAQWDEARNESGREAVLEEAKTYMAEFGWPKAQDHRGLSAVRTIDKMLAWIWLLGEDELFAKVEATDYAQYGAPKLKIICEHFGWPIPDDEPTQRMMRGEPCEQGCWQGCGE